MRYHRFSRTIPFILILFAVGNVWAGISLSENDFAVRERQIKERLIVRAETYLDSLEQASSRRVTPYVTVVRGLLKAGISPEHPFLRQKINILLQLRPQNKYEAAQLHEISLILRLQNMESFVGATRSARVAKLFSHPNDCSEFQAQYLADSYNESYRRYGVVRLPHGFNPERPLPVPTPERHSNAVTDVAAFGPISSRNDLTLSLPESFSPRSAFLYLREAGYFSTPHRHGYVLIVQTDRRQD